jgi:hypothetical protein
MAARRGRSEDSIGFDHKTPAATRTSTGGAPVAGVASSRLGTDKTASESGARCVARPRLRFRDKLRDLHSDIEAGFRKPQAVTVQAAAEDWLANGLDGRSAKTVPAQNRNNLHADARLQNPGLNHEIFGNAAAHRARTQSRTDPRPCRRG